MGDEARCRRAPHVLQRRTLGAYVLLAVDGDEPLIVAGTGADVWTLLADVRTLADLVDALSAHYSGDPDVIAADVRALLDTLVAAGVVLEIDAPGRS